MRNLVAVAMRIHVVADQTGLMKCVELGRDFPSQLPSTFDREAGTE